MEKVNKSRNSAEFYMKSSEISIADAEKKGHNDEGNTKFRLMHSDTMPPISVRIAVISFLSWKR